MPYPPCPLCDRPLDEHHWRLVLERHRAEQEEIRGYLWVTREQLTTSEREIQVLRQEYRDLDRELATYALALERRGQLQEQIQGTLEGRNRLRQVIEEWTTIHQSLQSGSFAPELLEELHLLDRSLQHLNYDDRTHALARGEVDRWRWAEIRSAELKQAQRQFLTLDQRQPELETRCGALEAQLRDLQTSPLQQQIQQIDRQLAELNYRLDHHAAVRQALRQSQVWQTRYQELQQVQHHHPQLEERLGQQRHLLSLRCADLERVTALLSDLTRHLEQTPNPEEPLHTLERQMQERRSHLDEALANLGRIQQQQQHLRQLQGHIQEQEQHLQGLRRQHRVYQELGQSFGKNGIQALMIENLLPQLEAETNRILGQLSANQLHVQFVTQRSGKRRGNQPSDRLIDTLDILIADIRGTRPYETYSGGEAFRVNFAIRLALSRLLAQRSGTALQLLIVDEGFGTQDDAGCDRLIAAIQAIASDFACILTVTHMPRFKEAFQSRIEVYKTEDGSRLSLTV